MKHIRAALILAVATCWLGSSVTRAQDKSEEVVRSYCRKPDQAVLIFLDRTTVYDLTDRKILEQGLDATVSRLRVGNRIVMRTIVDDPFRSARVFDDCKPGCRYDAWWEPAFCNTFRAKGQQAEFQNRMADSVQWIPKRPEEYSHSAIFATIATVTQDYRDAHVRYVVIFSDLLENSGYASTVAVMHEKPARIVRSLATRGIVPAVQGADVIVYGVGRSDALDRHGLTFEERQNLIAVWTDWLKGGGARSVRIYQWYPSPS